MTVTSTDADAANEQDEIQRAYDEAYKQGYAEYMAKHAESHAAERERVVREAVLAARARLRTIMTSPLCKGREALAHHLAYETEFEPERCLGILDKAPTTAAKPGSPLDHFMRSAGNPDVGVDDHVPNGTGH